MTEEDDIYHLVFNRNAFSLLEALFGSLSNQSFTTPSNTILIFVVSVFSLFPDNITYFTDSFHCHFYLSYWGSNFAIVLAADIHFCCFFLLYVVISNCDVCWNILSCECIPQSLVCFSFHFIFLFKEQLYWISILITAWP